MKDEVISRDALHRPARRRRVLQGTCCRRSRLSNMHLALLLFLCSLKIFVLQCNFATFNIKFSDYTLLKMVK